MPLRQAQSRREILEYAFGRLVVSRMSKVYSAWCADILGQPSSILYNACPARLAVLCCTHGPAWPDTVTKSDKIQF